MNATIGVRQETGFRRIAVLVALGLALVACGPVRPTDNQEPMVEAVLRDIASNPDEARESLSQLDGVTEAALLAAAAKGAGFKFWSVVASKRREGTPLYIGALEDNDTNLGGVVCLPIRNGEVFNATYVETVYGVLRRDPLDWYHQIPEIGLIHAEEPEPRNHECLSVNSYDLGETWQYTRFASVPGETPRSLFGREQPKAYLTLTEFSASFPEEFAWRAQRDQAPLSAGFLRLWQSSAMHRRSKEFVPEDVSSFVFNPLLDGLDEAYSRTLRAAMEREYSPSLFTADALPSACRHLGKIAAVVLWPVWEAGAVELMGSDPPQARVYFRHGGETENGLERHSTLSVLYQQERPGSWQIQTVTSRPDSFTRSWDKDGGANHHRPRLTCSLSS